MFNYPILTATRQVPFCQKLKSPSVKGPVDHVAFVIHGIGQQTEQFGFFQKHMQSLSDTTDQVIEENGTYRSMNIKYIPIEWHKHIHEETDKAMDNITPNSIPYLRMINNDYLADAFFYLSKDRGQSIIQHVTHTFNCAYIHFIKENPSFNGKIAILAYSMGGIITWDILCHQIAQPYSNLDLEFPPLVFKPDYLFNLGSPLSAFLTVRNQDPKLYRPDPSIVFENIVHPYDPLGYRFEPMLNSDYKHRPAVLIHPSTPSTPYLQDQLRQLWSKGMEWIACVSRPKKSSLQDTLVDSHCSPEDDMIPTPKLSLDSLSSSDDDDDDDELINDTYTQTYYFQRKRRFEAPLQNVKKQKRDDLLNSTMTRGIHHADLSIHQVPIDQRIDYVLQPERFMGYIQKNHYLSGLTAHFSYWTHKDLMWHIVQRLNHSEFNNNNKAM
ncbi:Phospholipase DDHD1 [Choanephora cucurbitarum]|uniref:Phospholipase DDHD1 n=1 Tax=Choanephora cucurbitarum TaxID=101091 RepID=A0A1C7NAW6_9FUNG|nr:Phospholipase DDHD1 [Choanephora cucurbitarum]